MRPANRTHAIRGIGRWTAAPVAALVLVLYGPATADAQQDDPAPATADQSEAEPQTGSAAPTDDPLTFLDSVTVSATLRPAPVRETPGMVSVIDSQTIEERLVRDFADLVKYEPGVYVENNVTRLGLNGFNIRGIGGNRVMTQVDGVQTSEQFDFGPFNVHQVGLDVDALKTVEIVRSANSALYGSDALGGVVSLFTKDPADYLGNRQYHLGAKTTWDGRSDAISGNLALAAGTERVQGSLFASVHRGNEIGNKGTVETADDTRTAPNPQDIEGTQLLAKLVVTPSPGNTLRTTAEVYDTRVETEWLSDRGLLDFGAFRYLTADSDALDTQERRRISIDHTLVDRGLDQFSWRLYGQFNDTSQVIDRERMTFGFGPPFPSARHGTLDFEQVGYGTSLQGQQWLGDPERGVLITAGAGYKSDYFDILRDRAETHGTTGEPVPTSLIFPTKYFPESTVSEAGAYLQAELQFGRFSVVPGVRYDHFALDANQDDPVFVASLNPTAADFSNGAVSPKLGVAASVTDTLTVHAQYAGGFRAPPYSAINTGFTNPRGGYTTLPNPDLRAETSRNVEVGVRAAFERVSIGLTVFSNRYDDFIASTSLGLNPVTRLLEFQSRNLDEAEIEGVELRGEAYLSDSVMLRWSYARINGVEIFEDTVVPPLAEETQLGEIAPNEGVLGLRYVRPSGRWGGELSVRMVEAYQYGREESVRARGLPGHRPGEFRLACRIADVPPGPAEPDRQQALRVVERARAPGERPGDRPVFESRAQRRHVARVRVVRESAKPTSGREKPYACGHARKAHPQATRVRRRHGDSISNETARCVGDRVAGARIGRGPGHPAARARGPRRLEPTGSRAGFEGRLEPAGRGGVRHGEQAHDPGRAGSPGRTGRRGGRRGSAVRLVAQQRHAGQRVPAGEPRRGAAATGGLRSHGRPPRRRRVRWRPGLRLDHAHRSGRADLGDDGAGQPRPGRRDSALPRTRRQRAGGRGSRRGGRARTELGRGQRSLAREHGRPGRADAPPHALQPHRIPDGA